MDTFEKAFRFILLWEGGYTLHKNPTEPYYTFAGIYQGAYPNWEGWRYIKEGNIDKAKELVKEFYLTHYWKYLKCDYLPSKVAVALFDTAVNMGRKRAVRGLQRIVKVKVDGIMGRKTIEAIGSHNEDELVWEYLKRRVIFYSRLSPKYNIYKRGWINRVFSLLKYIEEV